MGRRRRIAISLGLILLLLVALILGVLLTRGLPILLGFTTKVFASGVYVGQRAPEEVIAQDITMDIPLLDWSVKPAAGTATMTMGILARRQAQFTEGVGVTLLPPGADAVAYDRNFTPATAAPLDPAIPWPLGSGNAEIPPPAATAAALETAVDWAFGGPEPGTAWGTRAAVIVHDGRIVAERYGDGFDRHTPLLGWSMTKSVTSALVGILVRQGKLERDAPAPVPEWAGQDDPRQEITLDMLLRMSSGLAFDEDYGNPFGDALPMLFLSDDFGSYAARQPLAAPPDTLWSYSSGTTNLIARIIRQTVGGSDADYFNFPHTALFNRIGMRSAVMEPDPSGTFVGSSYMYATARDWARFGLLYLQDGVWNGTRILPEGWVAYSTTPTPEADKGRYGAHWWLNAGKPPRSENRPMPGLPADLYYASGHEGQFVVVVPSHQAVIVRLGLTTEGQFDLEGFVGPVLDALDGEPRNGA